MTLSVAPLLPTEAFVERPVSLLTTGATVSGLLAAAANGKLAWLLLDPDYMVSYMYQT